MVKALNQETQDFISSHQDDDVRQLALQGTKNPAVDMPMALQQIAGRQTARRKLPTWAAVEGILYPPHLNMEQCSSEQAARYKAQVVNGLCADRQSFVDLTGGFGVDFYWMSQGFSRRCYVEQNDVLCDIAEHNFHLLNLSCSVNRGNASAFLSDVVPATIIFLDPARRNEHGGRTYGIADCTPNVLELLPLLMQKAHRVMLKLSPMLDWRKAIEDIEQAASTHQVFVHEVHIVSVDNECKELLMVLGKEPVEGLRLVCVNNDSIFEVTPKPQTYSTKISNLQYEDVKLTVLSRCTEQESADAFLFEPNASIMKAGCFDEVARRFGVRPVSINSHLFLSPIEIHDFPGRRFRIVSISSMNRQELKRSLIGIERANITVRNFPLSVDQLRKKLRLKDGGDTFIFATTNADNAHQLFICRKIG